jgi:hypothetical protein
MAFFFWKGEDRMFIFHIFNLSVSISKNEKHLRPEKIEHKEHVKKIISERDGRRDTYLYMYS